MTDSAPEVPVGRIEIGGLAKELQCPLAILIAIHSHQGDVARFQMGANSFLLVSDPADVKHILHSDNYVRSPLIRTILGEGLLAADGPYWERQRRLMLSEFKPVQIERMVGVFAQVAAERVAAWRNGTEVEGRVNLSREMDRIAIANVSRALFGAELNDRFLDAFGVVMRQLGRVGNSAVFGFPLTLHPGDNRSFQDAMQVMEDDVARVVTGEGRRADGVGNLLCLLQQSGEETGGEQLTARQIRDEVVTMVTAGHETTAVTLCWSWFSILSHPHVAARFHDEVREVLGSRAITPADIPRLRYTRMIVDETLRMYPPVWLVARTALRDDNSGRFFVAAGTGVLISPYVIHRRASHWNDAETFDPERFASGSDSCEPYGYLPFLAGRHLCLGKYFAITEAIVVLATIAQQCRFQQLPPQRPTFDAQISLRMRGELIVNVD